MAAFFLLLAILGGVLVGDLVWENTGASEVTVLDRSVSGYSLGWLLAAAAGLGLIIGLLLVASASSTKRRRERRRRVRSMQHNPEYEGIKPGREHASWLDESFGRRETAADAGQPLPRQSEP
jgi:hypothetical protein